MIQTGGECGLLIKKQGVAVSPPITEKSFGSVCGVRQIRNRYITPYFLLLSKSQVAAVSLKEEAGRTWYSIYMAK